MNESDCMLSGLPQVPPPLHSSPPSSPTPLVVSSYMHSLSSHSSNTSSSTQTHSVLLHFLIFSYFSSSEFLTFKSSFPFPHYTCSLLLHVLPFLTLLKHFFLLTNPFSRYPLPSLVSTSLPFSRLLPLQVFLPHPSLANPISRLPP